MAKRSENRNKAYEIWRGYKGDISLKEIAERVGVSDGLIRKWKSQDKWSLDGNIGNGNMGNVTKKTGAPYGNKNAVGHGAPKGNKNAARPIGLMATGAIPTASRPANTRPFGWIRWMKKKGPFLRRSIPAR